MTPETEAHTHASQRVDGRWGDQTRDPPIMLPAAVPPHTEPPGGGTTSATPIDISRPQAACPDQDRRADCGDGAVAAEQDVRHWPSLGAVFPLPPTGAAPGRGG